VTNSFVNTENTLLIGETINELKPEVLTLAAKLPFFLENKHNIYHSKRNLKVSLTFKVCQLKLIMQPVNNIVSII